jgi:hypothetical protein
MVESLASRVESKTVKRGCHWQKAAKLWPEPALAAASGTRATEKRRLCELRPPPADVWVPLALPVHCAFKSDRASWPATHQARAAPAAVVEADQASTSCQLTADS